MFDHRPDNDTDALAAYVEQLAEYELELGRFTSLRSISATAPDDDYIDPFDLIADDRVNEQSRAVQYGR